MNETFDTEPMGVMGRLKAAAGVMMTGKAPNPLAEPKDRSRARLVEEWNERCLEERKFWKPIFERIRREQEFGAGNQWPEGYSCRTDEKEPFVGDVMQQMLNRKTASLYAKNPTPEAKQVDMMWFEVWDGSQESLNGARSILEAAQPILQAAAAAQAMGQEIPPPPPQLEMAKAIVEDYERGMAEKARNLRIARTASLLLAQQWRIQSPEFLASMKQLVTRVLTSRVGYIKVMYRRDGEEQEPLTEQANLPVDQVRLLQQHLAAAAEPGFDPESAEAEEMRLLMQSLANQKQTPDPRPQTQNPGDAEGLVYDFLGATSVLVDRRCTCLREFVGARWVAHEIILPIEDAEKRFGVSLRDAGAVRYTDAGVGREPAAEAGPDNDEDRGNVCLWHIEDKESGQCYVVCDGVKEFLAEPYPNEPEVTRFWSIVPVVFNVQEVDRNEPDRDVTIYPRSDVRLAMPMQQNINISGEAMREHRVAARPWKVGVKSKFDDADLRKLAAAHAAHDCILLNNLNAGEKITDYIQPGPVPEFRPELYDNSQDSQAMMLATGMQPANLGAQRGDEKATGQAIAEGSRISADQSNAHDLDTALSTVAQMSFEMLIQEMPMEAVKRRVGRGALWPELSAGDVRNEIYLQVEAGSSGRPNQALEINNFKVLGPMLQELLVTSGKSLEPLIKDAVRRLNDKADVDDYLKPAQLPAGPQPVAPAAGPQTTDNGTTGPLAAGMPAAQVQPGANGAPPVPPQLPPASRAQVQQTAAA
jgi:hypothetical protein